MRAVTAAGVKLDAAAKRTVIVAEDVGIFAACSLVRALDDRDLAWELHYDAWSRDDAAFLDELRAFGSRVTLHVRSERRGAVLAWEPIVASCDASTRIYAAVSASSHEALARAIASDGRGLASRVRWASTTEVRSRAPRRIRGRPRAQQTHAARASRRIDPRGSPRRGHRRAPLLLVRHLRHMPHARPRRRPPPPRRRAYGLRARRERRDDDLPLARDRKAIGARFIVVAKPHGL